MCLYFKIEGTGENAGKCTAYNTDYLLTITKVAYLYYCKTEETGNNVGKSTACNDSYTLSSGTCTKKKAQKKYTNNDYNSSFGYILQY